MKKITFILANLFLILSSCFGQSMNNNYPVDNEDLINIFNMQGINMFKFPFELKVGEYISLSYCIYDDGIEKECYNAIEDMQFNFNMTIDHHLARRDTTVSHRIYFMNREDSLWIQIVAPGFSTGGMVDISKLRISSCTASLNIKENLPEKQDILSFYASKYEDSLDCPTGLSPEKMIKKYDFVLIFFAERITKERAKNILKEDYYIQNHAKNQEKRRQAETEY
jgi:hypothetical protein